MSRKGSEPWLAERIERWFAKAARPLPWRSRRSGWRAFVSEVMLQQTQASRVAERFADFMRRFSSPTAMAMATEQEVLAAWQGLGYYRRARLLRRAAIQIVKEHGGRVPRSAELLRELPGVGRYTAGAIASTAFGAREAICDGNVTRVILRLRGAPLALREPRAQALAWREAEELVRCATNPGVLNEGLMELGATICTPRQPRCGACPVRDGCTALEQGKVDEIPRPPKRRTVRLERVDTTVVTDSRRTRVLLQQRKPDGMWAAMWETPEGVFGEAQRVGHLRHLTTHRDFRIQVHALAVSTVSRAGAPEVALKGRWIARAQLHRIPMSNATKRVLELALPPSGDRAARAR
ncbi:MAG: A/G-specific adenine glycosylase [Phycisphaeraceae bacterium]|nr:A/G-specific adenine glycosylase [Phycisphaeraceae bacterium]